MFRLFSNDRTKTDHIPNNLTREELPLVSSLSARRDIVFKPVDKGEAIVVMDTKNYEEEIWKQLSNTYMPLDSSPVFWVQVRIKQTLIQAMKDGIIDQEICTCLTADYPILLYQ